MFGVWHSYKYCVSMVWRLYFPLLSVLLNPMLRVDVDVVVLCRPKLGYLERVFGVLYVLAPQFCPVFESLYHDHST